MKDSKNVVCSLLDEREWERGMELKLDIHKFTSQWDFPNKANSTYCIRYTSRASETYQQLLSFSSLPLDTKKIFMESKKTTT